MKRQPALSGKFLLPFFVFISFLGCQVEEPYGDTRMSDRNFKVTHLKYADIKHENKIVDRVENFNKKILGRNTEADKYGFIIDTLDIAYIEGDDTHSYTFKVVRENDSVALENLVLQLKDDGIYQAYLMQYDFTNEDMELIKNGQPIPDQLSKTKVNILPEAYRGGGGDFPPLPTGCTWELLSSEYSQTETTWELINYYQPVCKKGGGGGGGSSAGGGTGGTGSGGTGAGPGSGGNTGGTSGGGGSTGNPGTGGEGGGEGEEILTTILPVVPATLPCAELKKITNNPALKNALEVLSISTDPDKEYGYAVKKNKETGQYRPPEAVSYDINRPNNINVTNCLGGENIGLFHTHPDSENGWFPMFSPEDIKYLLLVAMKHNANGQPKNYSEYFITLTVHEGNYALKIKDWLKFVNAINANYSRKNGIKETLEKAYKKIGTGGSITKMKKAMLEIFKKFDLGVGLYKANEDLTEWSEVILPDNSTPSNSIDPINKPCN